MCRQWHLRTARTVAAVTAAAPDMAIARAIQGPRAHSLHGQRTTALSGHARRRCHGLIMQLQTQAVAQWLSAPTRAYATEKLANANVLIPTLAKHANVLFALTVVRSVVAASHNSNLPMRHQRPTLALGTLKSRWAASVTSAPVARIAPSRNARLARTSFCDKAITSAAIAPAEVCVIIPRVLASAFRDISAPGVNRRPSLANITMLAICFGAYIIRTVELYPCIRSNSSMGRLPAVILIYSYSAYAYLYTRLATCVALVRLLHDYVRSLYDALQLIY